MAGYSEAETLSQDYINDEVFEANVTTTTLTSSSSSTTLMQATSCESVKTELSVAQASLLSGPDVAVEPLKELKPEAEGGDKRTGEVLAEERPVVVVETNLEDYLNRKDRESFSRDSKVFTEQELTLAEDLTDWFEREVVEERSFVGHGFSSRPPIVVSVNNTAKKREIFEVKAASIVGDVSMDRRKSSAAADAVGAGVDKSKFEESVDEIRDVLGRLRPSSNFPYMKQTIENLLVSKLLLDLELNSCITYM